MEKRSGRCASIDLWKFIFAVVIVLYHSIYLVVPSLRYKYPTLLRGGYIGVEFFAIVSGFLMAASAQKLLNNPDNGGIAKNTIAFLKRKIAVVYPFYFIAFIFNFIIVQVYSGSGVREILVNGVYSLWGLLFMRISGIHGYYTIGPAWYISAMLLVMLFLYPILLKIKKTFTHIIAPLIVIAVWGYMSQEVGTIARSTPHYFLAAIRMTANISLGCICFELCKVLKEVRFAKWVRPVFTAVEWLCFAGVIVVSQYRFKSQLDFILIAALAVGITLSFSGQTGGNGALFKGGWTAWLARFSIPLLFCHASWGTLLRIFVKEGTYASLLPWYLVISILTALLCQVLADKVLLPGIKALKRKMLA